jgi:hypothetical protein
MERPSSTTNDLPLTREQLVQRETWMMEEGNWRVNHSVPSVGEHYRYMWKWDSAKGVVINARRGEPERAAVELATLLKYIDPQTGFLPNKIFATQKHKTWRDYPEAWNFNNNKVGTSYSQPPLEAWAAMETYDSYLAQDRKCEGLELLAKIYGEAEDGGYTGLKGSIAYWYEQRQNSLEDPLLGIVHPNETGRDSDEANKPWLLYSDKKGVDAKREWLDMQKLGWDLGRLGRDPKKQRVDWIPEQVREKYWVNDVMFNAMYVRNLRYMADIASILSEHSSREEDWQQYEADIEYYERLADSVESEILTRMWSAKEGYFYNLDKDGKQIPVDSATGLFPLLLDNIDRYQTMALLNKLESPDWFATNYPIPTHAVRSPFYDPDPTGFKNKFTPQWSGPVWLDVNHIIAEEGLVPRAETYPGLRPRLMGQAAIIAVMSEELLAGEPKSMEYYSPETGKGMRVADFMWTNLGLHFEKTEQALAKNS